MYLLFGNKLFRQKQAATRESIGDPKRAAYNDSIGRLERLKGVPFIGGALLLASSAAFGADIGYTKAPLPAQAPIMSPWDGLYVGGNAGYGWSDFRANASLLGLSASTSESGNGFVGGGQLGYNKTFGAGLLGLETDFQGTSIDANPNRSIVRTDLPWFGTTRVRAGFLAAPAWLIYATGGVAYGEARVSANALPITATAFGVGWAAGGGVEWQLGNGFSVGAEYLHAAFAGPSLDVGALHLGTQADVDIARGKLNWRF